MPRLLIYTFPISELGYGHYFAGDLDDAGYTIGVDQAFKTYVRAYEDKLNAAAEEMEKQNSG